MHWVSEEVSRQVLRTPTEEGPHLTQLTFSHSDALARTIPNSALLPTGFQGFVCLFILLFFFFLHDFWTYQYKYKLYGCWGDCRNPNFIQTHDPSSPWVDSKKRETL